MAGYLGLSQDGDSWEVFRSHGGAQYLRSVWPT